MVEYQSLLMESPTSMTRSIKIIIESLHDSPINGNIDTGNDQIIPIDNDSIKNKKNDRIDGEKINIHKNRSGTIKITESAIKRKKTKKSVVEKVKNKPKYDEIVNIICITI